MVTSGRRSGGVDAVSDSGDLGLYVRLARLPNQDVCLFTACVCGPGRPSIMLVEIESL